MEAVAGITQRIMQIQSQIAQLTPRAPVTVPSSTSVGSQTLAASRGGTAASGGAMSFESVLSQAVSGPSTAQAGIVGSGKALINAKGVPTELLSHGNGRVPAHALGQIEGTEHRLWTPAARSLEALRAAAARDGVTIRITDSYRSYDSQVDVARRKGLYSQGGLAAVPGTSKHGWGMAVDLGLDAKAQAWMTKNAGAFGFVEDVPREPWHWGYHPTH